MSRVATLRAVGMDDQRLESLWADRHVRVAVIGLAVIAAGVLCFFVVRIPAVQIIGLVVALLGAMVSFRALVLMRLERPDDDSP